MANASKVRRGIRRRQCHALDLGILLLSARTTIDDMENGEETGLAQRYEAIIMFKE